MNTSTTPKGATEMTIKPRKCSYCGSDTYHGTMGAHLAARHASKAQPMAQRYCKNCGSAAHTFCNR